MGLLSDTKNRHKLAELLHNHNSILSTVCYIGGFVAFLLMAHMPFNNSTYFSENALLPGIVDGEFYGGADADSFTKEYISVLKQQKGAVPVDWIHNKLRQFGLDVYEHNYSYVYPLQLSENQVISAKNIYAILRAPKSASTESVVLSTVIRNSDGPLPSNAAGVGLILAMAKFFKKHTYWAKDIIFLMTDHEAIGTQAWLEAYHSTHSKYIHSEDINGRAGSIQAAINIEIESSHIGYFDIRSEGLNGQLPNLDLINLCVRLCEKERMTPKLHHRGDYWNMDSKEGFQHSLKTYLSMMWHQASGSVSGNHGLYHRYGIEAVTLAGVKSRRATSKQGFTPMGRVIEGIFRGLNNLLERFHQSFFFYLLPATHRYVSIGNYMPPFGVMALGLLLKALSLWLNDESKDEVDDQAGGDTNIKKEQKPNPFLNIIPYLIVSQLYGLVAFMIPSFLSTSAKSFSMEISEALTLGIIALWLSCILFPWMFKRKKFLDDETYRNSWILLKCLALLHQALILYGVAVMNISLGFFLAAVLVPVSLLLNPDVNRFLKAVQGMLLLLISPISIIFFASFLHNAIYSTFAFNELIGNSWITMKHSIYWSVTDFHLLGNWLYSYLALAVFPNWLLLWCILWQENRN